ncbi:hypothetical protein FP511_03655 [Streptococcus agalactiae]|uniref:hypothetical protein n=1 Tax=Streptococcus agalactiae TaxID=1311 RepID=UPI00162A77D9|nr:hypothetical protein [Streptococcus agalactiae]QNG00699.1 hypothetical protein FP511_03655 [Streptococcus agalactiae]HEO5099888.1 hypothetical protein [Streptococcus agalactiae]
MGKMAPHFPTHFFNSTLGFKANVGMWEIFFNSPLYKLKEAQVKIYYIIRYFFPHSHKQSEALDYQQKVRGKIKNEFPTQK